MKLNFFLSVPMVGLMLTGLAHSQPVTLTNSNFETPAVYNNILTPLLGGTENFVGTGTKTYLSGSSGWYVSGATANTGTVSLVNPGSLALLAPITGQSGQYLVLNGGVALGGFLSPGASGGIAYDVSLTENTPYTVSYQTAALSIGVATANTVQMSAGVDGLTVTSPSGGALVNIGLGGFNTQSFSFTTPDVPGAGTSYGATLHFYENAAFVNLGGVALDNVTLTAVPEPHEYAAMFIAFVMGLAFVRKMKRNAAPAPEQEALAV